MKLHFLFTLMFTTAILLTNLYFVSAQNANKTLSNLNTPTAVNTSLVPQSDNTIDLGSSSLGWKDFFLKGTVYLDGNSFISNKGNGTFIGTAAGTSNTGSYSTGVGYNALYSNTTGMANTGTGYGSLYKNTVGGWNTAAGVQALYSNTSGSSNTAIGNVTMLYNTLGSHNCSMGYSALYNNTSGNYNTAIGNNSLYLNTTGNSNTAIGNQALRNTKGYSNVGVGKDALYKNTLGHNLVAVGDSALYNQTEGGYSYANVAVGSKALYKNTTGYYNSAHGYRSLYSNVNGAANTAIGFESGYNNISGSDNTFLGSFSGHSNSDGISNTFIGWYSGYANSGGTGNTYVGCLAAGSSADLFNATAIGNGAEAAASNQVMLGNNAITSVKAAGSFVIYSDGRFKKNLREDVPGLDFIELLKPVTYQYNIHALNDHTRRKTADKMQEAETSGIDPKEEEAISAKERIVYTGFVAQDVESAAKKIGYDFSGVYKPQNDKDVYGLSYADFVVPLVKAVQELNEENKILHSTNDSMKIEIKSIKSQNATLESRLHVLELQSGTSLNDGGIKISTSESVLPMLGQNVPNPFDQSTVIPFRIPKGCTSASIVVSEFSTGRIITAIPISCDETHVMIEAASLTAGTYVYSLYVDGNVMDTKKMVIAK